MFLCLKFIRREKDFVGESFCHLANISSPIPDEKFFPQM